MGVVAAEVDADRDPRVGGPELRLDRKDGVGQAEPGCRCCWKDIGSETVGLVSGTCADGLARMLSRVWYTESSSRTSSSVLLLVEVVVMVEVVMLVGLLYLLLLVLFSRSSSRSRDRSGT